VPQALLTPAGGDWLPPEATLVPEEVMRKYLQLAGLRPPVAVTEQVEQTEPQAFDGPYFFKKYKKIDALRYNFLWALLRF